MDKIFIKSEHEVELMYRANQVVARIFEACENFIRPGISTKDIDDLVFKIIAEHGAKPNFLNYGTPPFPGSACVSVNDEVVHGIPRKDRIIQSGDIVSVDVGCELDLYMADACRTFCVGEVDARVRELVRVTEESFWLGLEQAVLGKRIGDISHAVQVHCEKHGFGIVREMSGHGLGRNLHEGPELLNYGNPGRGLRLEAGMTLCLEPMVTLGDYRIGIESDEWTIVTLDGSPAAHYENCFVVTPAGPKVLSLTKAEALAHPEYAYQSKE